MVMPSAEQTGVPAVLGSPTVMVAAKADTLTVTWNAVTNATGYKVQWKSGSETYPAADEGVRHARASHYLWREHHDPQNFWADRRDDLHDSRHRHEYQYQCSRQCPLGGSDRRSPCWAVRRVWMVSGEGGHARP